jgi:hypothetical protein
METVEPTCLGAQPIASHRKAAAACISAAYAVDTQAQPTALTLSGVAVSPIMVAMIRKGGRTHSDRSLHWLGGTDRGGGTYGEHNFSARDLDPWTRGNVISLPLEQLP